jgi:glycosyltransferase involved in cell wall biosynthesis
MLLTIGIPTKNSEKHVLYALRSIARQVLPKNLEIEIVIVDGSSRDRTLEYIDKGLHIIKGILGTKLVEMRVLFEHVGRVGYARNIIVRYSQGDWILWLDSDNIIEEHYIWKYWYTIRDIDTSIAVVFPSKVVPIARNLTSKVITCYLLSSSPSNIESTVKRARVPVTGMQGVFTRRRSILEVRGFNEKARAYEDVDLFLRLGVKGYAFKPFDGKLYAFVKEDLHSWLRQAFTWDYYKTLIQLAYNDRKTVSEKIELHQRLFKFFRDYIQIISNVGRKCKASQVPLTPLFFLLRKMSFYIGERIASNDYKKYYLR